MTEKTIVRWGIFFKEHIAIIIDDKHSSTNHNLEVANMLMGVLLLNGIKEGWEVKC